MVYCSEIGPKQCWTGKSRIDSDRLRSLLPGVFPQRAEWNWSVDRVDSQGPRCRTWPWPPSVSPSWSCFLPYFALYFTWFYTIVYNYLLYILHVSCACICYYCTFIFLETAGQKCQKSKQCRSVFLLAHDLHVVNITSVAALGRMAFQDSTILMGQWQMHPWIAWNMLKPCSTRNDVW